MDSFVFDLQLFADPITVSLSDAKAYLGANGTWYSSITALNAAKTSLLATLADKTLTVAVGTAANTITIKSTDNTGAALDGYTVTTVASFDTTSGAAVAVYETGSAIKSVVKFVQSGGSTELGTINDVATGTNETGTAKISLAYDNTGSVFSAEVPTGCTVNSMTVTSETGVFVLAQNSADQSLTTGTVSVAASATVLVGTNKYKNETTDAGSNPTTATLTASAGEATLTAGKVALAANKSAITANGATISAKAFGDGIFVDSTGKVNGLAKDEAVVVNGVTYTAQTKKDDQSTDHSFVTVSGASTSGVYTGVATADDFSNVVITASSSAVTVTETGNANFKIAEVTDKDTFAIPKATEKGTRYFKVTYDVKTGKLALEDTATSGADDATRETAAATDSVGYFAVTTNYDYGDATATVVYKDSATKQVSKLNTPVTIDFSALTTADGTNALKSIDVTGVSTATTVTGVPATVKANVTGHTGDIGYAPSYKIGTKTIEVAAGETKFYSLVYSDPGQYGVVTVSIGAAATGATDKTAYFKVEYNASPGTGKSNYTITYDANSDTRATAIQALDWTGIAVDASAVASTESITGATGAASAKYIISAPVGVVITSPSGDVVTPKWNSGAPAYKITNDITLSTTAGTNNYVVTRSYENNDGNPTYTIDTNHTATPAANASYFTVTTDATGKKVTITYTDGAGYGMTGLKSGSNDVKVGVVSTALTGGGWTVDISGAAADFKMDSVPAGVTVTGGNAGDSITHDSVYKVNFTLALASVTTSPTYFVLTAADEDEAGYKVVTATTTTDNTGLTNKSYFTVTNDGAGTYTVAYTEDGTSPLDLGASATGTSGNVVIDVGSDATVKTIAITKANDGNAGQDGEPGIKYHVDNATSSIKKIAETITGGSEGDKTADTNYVTYDEVNNLASASKIELSNLTTSQKTYYYKIGTSGATAKGVTEYTLTGATTITAADDNAFKLVYDAEKKTITLTYETATTENKKVPWATIATLTSKIPIDATLASTGTPDVETIVLTVDTEDASVGYALTNVPAGTTITNQGEDDTVEYKTDWIMGDANTITLEAPSDEAVTKYFAVSATNVKGQRIISISDTALDTSSVTEKNLPEFLAKNAPQGYYKVTTATDGAVDVEYVKGEVDGVELGGNLGEKTVKVDATAATGTVKLVSDASLSNPVTYTISGLKHDQTVNASDSKSTCNPTQASYIASYVMSATPALTIPSGTGTTYYTVTAGNADSQNQITYTVSAAVAEKDKGSHYFVIKNAEYGTTVTYVNADNAAAYNLADMGLVVGVSAANLTSPVTTLNMADSATKVNYAITNVASTIEVTGTDDDDTVAKKVAPTLADGQKITVGTGTTYWVVTKDETASTETETVVKVSQYTEGVPTAKMNYFTVENTGGAVTMTYTPATSGDSYASISTGTLTIDAEKATSALTVANGAAKYAIEKLPGAVTSVTGIGSSDTISYTTSFAWATGTYFVEIDKTTNKFNFTPGATVTTTKGAATEYAQVGVTVDPQGVATLTLNAKTRTATGSNGVMVDTSNTTDATNVVFTAPSTALKLNAGGTTDYVITGVAADSVITNTKSGTDTTITTAALEKGQSIKVTPNSGSEITYTAGDDGAITVYGSGAVKDGVLTLSDGVTALTGSTTTAGKVKSAVVTNGKGTGEVTLTFSDGEIKGITGLDADETLTVTMGSGSVTYQYKYNATTHMITKIASDGSSTTYAGVNDTTSNILAATYGARDTAITGVGTFAWNTGAKTAYYLADSSGTTEVKEATSTGSIVKNNTYVEATVAEAGGTYTLTLTPAIGNAAGLVDTTDSYTGTINVTATGKKVSYTKDAKATYATTFSGAADGTGVAAGSSFANMFVAGDSVVSGALDDASNDTITYNGVAYAISGKGTLEFATTVSKTATAAAKGGLLAGVVKVATGTTYQLSDGTTIAGSENTVITVTADKGLTTIAGLSGNNETITIIDADGVKTVYENTSTGSAYTVEKTVTAKDGSVTVKTLTFASAEALAENILGTSTPSGSTFTNDFAFGADKKFGYFKVTSNKTDVKADSNPVSPADKAVYIKAENAYVSTPSAMNTLKLTALVWDEASDSFKDVDGEATKVTVTVKANSNPITYTAGTKEFNTAFESVAAGSVFSGLTQGDTVSSAASFTGSFEVNGTKYTAVDSSTLKVYAENTTTTYLVSGIVNVGGTGNPTEMVSAKEDGTSKQTLAYFAGTGTGAASDGVKVTYNGTNGGEIGAITGLTNGESIVITDADGKWTKYAASLDGKVCYMTDSTGAAKYATTFTDLKAATFGNVDSTTTSSFLWKDSSEGAATSITGYFLVTNDAATITNQTTPVTINYLNYGETYVYATYDRSSGALTLSKGTVATGGTPAHSAALEKTDKITLTVANAAPVTYTRGSEKSLTINGVGDGSVFTSLTSEDKVTTATMDAGKTVTVNGHAYTTGASNTTLVIGGDGIVTGGTFLLKNNSDSSANAITASVVDKDTLATTVTTVTNDVKTDKDGVAVTVADGGYVTGMTDLEAGEIVTISTVVTDKLGAKTTTTYKYEADEGTGSKKGQIVVTRTNVTTGEVATHTFTSNTQDVLATDAWTITAAVTSSKLDWTADSSTGYFLAGYNSTKKTYSLVDNTAASGKYNGKVDTQSGTPDITKSDANSVYLKVTTTKALSGVVTVGEITLVKVTSTGEFEPVTGTMEPVEIVAPTGGLVLPEHTFTANITGAPAGVSYTGLNAADTVTGTFTSDNVTKGTAITVGESATKKYSFTAGANVTFTITGAGTVTAGTMKLIADTPSLTDTKTGSTVAYTKGTTADGVIVAVTKADGVISITDFENGETVSVTDADRNVTTYTATSGTAFTKTIVAVGGETEVWKRTDGANSLNILSTGYKFANNFNWGNAFTQTANDKEKISAARARVGYFAIGTDLTSAAAVAANTAGTTGSDTQTITPTASNYYLRVVSTGSKTEGYTISSIKVLSGVELEDVTATTGAAAKLTITAPDGSLAISDSAVELAKNATERSMTINVVGAIAGATYTGLLATDTVSTDKATAGDNNLTSGQQITVGKKTWTAAQTTDAQIYGDGRAIAGTFLLDAANAELVAYDGSSKTTTVTRGGSTTTEARITFAAGAVTDIRYVEAGEIVQVVESTSAGTTKTVYTAETVGSDLVITREVTDKNGVTTTSTAVSDSESGNIMSLTYKDAGTTVSSQFDWTAAGGTGYFEVTPVVDSETKNITGIGTVNVATQSSKEALESGKYYLKAALSADGNVSSFGLYMMTADGLSTDNYLTSSVTGTINVAAPSDQAITLDASAPNLTKVAVNITGAIKESVITMKAGDTLRTIPTMAADDTIKVNGKTFKAAAAGTLRFYGAGLLSDGAVKMDATNLSSFSTTGADDNAATATDNVSLTLSGATTETPIVTVKNGVVASASGLGAATLTVTENGWSAAYTATGLTLTSTSATAGTTFTSLKLAAGNTFALTGAATNCTMAADGTVTAAKDASNAVTIQSATLSVATGGTVATTNSGTVSYTAAVVGSSVTVTVTNGKVTGVKGLGAGDKVVIGAVTYTADASNAAKITMTGTDINATATITAGGDILAAKYVGTGGDAIDKENPLEGQFTWNDTSNEATKRSVGYFTITETKSTGVKTAKVYEQTKKETVAPPKSGTLKYLTANVDDRVLSISAFSIDSTGATTDLPISGASAAFAKTDRITITAPTTTGITYEKGTSAFAVTINNLANGSTIADLDTDDKVVTTTLDNTKDEYVTINGKKYWAGAKNKLTFLGEGDATETTPTNTNATLLSGTIKLTSGETAILTGVKESEDNGDKTNDVIVEVSGGTTDAVIVRVANGVVASVTGLTKAGTTVTITPTNGTGTPVVYKAVNDGGTMVSRQEGTTGTIQYKAVASGKEVYSATGSGYKTLEEIPGAGFKWDTAAKQTAFISLGTTLNENKQLTGAKTFAQTGVTGVTSDVLTAATTDALQGYYLQFSTAYAANTKMTTISSMSLMQANAVGKLVAVKATAATYAGTLTIDGATLATATEATDGKVTFKMPASRDWTLNATNLAIGSVFTNLKDGDAAKGLNGDTIETADATDKELAQGTYELYSTVKDASNTVYITAVEKVTVKGDGVKADVTGGHITKLSGLYTKNETVTIVNDTANAGLETTVYKVTAAGTVQRTVTTADGLVTIQTATVTADTDVISGATWSTAVPSQVVSNFDWSMDKSTTGYFVISGKAATAKATPTTIKDASKSYIAVTVTENGKIGKISQVSFNKTTGAMDEAAANAFTGTLTITAPTAYALVLDRTDAINTANGSVGAAATFAVKNAIAGSTLTNLVAADTVTTAKLAKGGVVNVNDAAFTAGTANAMMTITMQAVDDRLQATLTAGTARIANGGYAYVGDTLIEVTKGTNGVTVTAKTKTVRGVATTGYTIGELAEGTTFTVETFGSGAAKTTYTKSGATLFKTVNNASDSGTTNYVYGISSKTSVDSTVLEKDSNWKPVTAALADADDGTKKSNFGAVTIDLATLDKRIATDTKATNAATVAGYTYDFVIDTYLDTTTSKTRALAASVVNNTNLQDLQTVVGTVTGGASYVYNATGVGTDANNVGQTIKVTKNWSVTGSAAADDITGATSGDDTIAGGAGDDTITLKGANDTVLFSFTGNTGKDTLKGYTAVKDSIYITDDGTAAGTADAFSVTLGRTDVLLHDGAAADGSDATNSVLLSNMGKGQAVSINGKTYYFGNTAATNTAFTYAEGAVYYGNASTNTTLSVGTDKTKATKTTLGDAVTVDLTNGDLYHEIDAVNASKSANSVVLAASDSGSSLTGGTYQSTLKGGAGTDVLTGGTGTDVFWLTDESGNLEGGDMVKSYMVGKDAIFLGEWDGASTAANLANGVTIKADGTNVILTKGDVSATVEKAVNTKNALLVSTDGTSANAMKYYVGSAKAKAKNAFTATLGTDTDTVAGGNFTSYYVGSSTDSTITDTLSVKLASKQKTAVNATFSLASEKLMGIDVLDTSGISITKVQSNVTLQGAATGTFTLKGEAKGTYTKDRFNLVNLEAGSNVVTISNINVGEVIELAEGVKLTNGAYDKKTKTYSYTMTSNGGVTGDLGTLKIVGATTALTQGTVGGTGADKNNVTLTR